MSVISKEIIKARIKDPKDAFYVTPIFDWKKQISESAIDLRLDNKFIIISRSQFPSLDPTKVQEIKKEIWQYQKPVTIGYGNKFVLHPNELVIASTIEYLAFPKDLIAYVIGRSSWGRLGLIIATATIINPGFKGDLTLELVNLGNVPIVLYPGLRIAQIVLHEIKNPSEIDQKSKYQFQIEPGYSKIYQDPELGYINPIKSKVIIGLTGHKGSGKRHISHMLVENESYKYYSLSHILKELFYQKYLKTGTRKELQDFGDYIRESKGADYLAKEMISRLQRDYLKNHEKIVIDGIRHPEEALLLQKLPNFYFIGINTAKTEIINILKLRGNLKTRTDIDELKKQNDLEQDEFKKNSQKDFIELLFDEKEFEERYQRDCGLKSNTNGSGQNVEGCLNLADFLISLDKGELSAQIQLYNDLKKIEGY